MPADVAARLERALAGAAQEPSGDTVVPDLGAVRRRRLAAVSWPYAAAASVVVVAVVGVAVATLGHGHHHPAADSAASAAKPPIVGTSAPAHVIQEESGQTYTPNSLTALVPSLVSGSPVSAANQSVPGEAAPELPVPSNAPLSHTNTLSEGSGTSSKSSGSSGGTPSTPPKAAAGLAPQRAYASASTVPPALRRYASSPSALDACAAYITDTSGAAPLAVDYARWSDAATHVHNSPSLILVFADPDDKTLLDVYVVAPACDASSLLDFTQVSK
jgi:hypothetical protein